MIFVLLTGSGRASAVPGCPLSRWPVLVTADSADARRPSGPATASARAGEPSKAASSKPSGATAKASSPATRSPTIVDCQDDEDGNGLDDGVESEIAQCVMPQFRFDSDENALRDDEPHVVFSAALVDPDLVRIHYAVLFANDGGYVLGTSFPCLTDDHHGDSEGLVVDVRIARTAAGPVAFPTAFRTSGPPGITEATSFEEGQAEDPGNEKLFGTHPIVYATAGKHHWLQHRDDMHYACECGPFGKCGSVHDRADGKGKWVVPSRPGQVPVFLRDPIPRWSERAGTTQAGILGGAESAAGRVVLRSASALDSNRNTWWNACELEQNGRLVPALHALRSDDLSDIGYPGDRVDADCFRGGFGGPCTETDAVANVVAWTRPLSARGTLRRILGYLLGLPDPRDEPQEGRVSSFPLAPGRR